MREQRERLELAGRVIGLVLLVLWPISLLGAIVAPSGIMVLQSFLLISMGGYLLRGAPMLMAWAFREPGRPRVTREVRAGARD